MIGTELAHYRITAKLGEGGMGEVWRATDGKLGREVAIKVLPESFASDPERLARFEREAKLLASLNHPNIAAIYGLEEAGGRRALILGREGPTLAERLAHGFLPLEECLTIARQIAEALEEAHEKGIVHRDLKPANVKLTPSGKVKVLDFGLAKALDPMSGSGSSPSQLAHSPTMTQGATMRGIVLGTAAYMSPEQARGAEVDRRADVWAFGVVLFEMLSGRSLFGGPTVTDTLASVLKEKPDLTRLPPATPERILLLLERCLRKDAHDRLHSIADARIVLAEVLRGETDEAAGGAGRARSPRPRWHVAAALAIAAVAGGLVALVASRLAAPAAAPPKLVRFVIPQPAEIVSMGAPKISPDGRHIAFAGRDKAGKAQVWLRALASEEVRPVPGSEGTNFNGRPFWSPDSRSVAFFAEGRLLRVPIDGGPAQKVGDALGADGSWSDNGTILYDGGAVTPIMAVSAAGGAPRPIIKAAEGEQGQSFGWPEFLPGGDRFLYVVVAADEEQRGLWIAKADGTDRRRVMAGVSRAEYVKPGWLLYVRDSTLLAQRFDAGSAKLAGDAIPVEDGLSLSQIGLAEFSTSDDGILALRITGLATEIFATFDRSGARVGEPIEGGDLGHPIFSPDGRWLAFDRATGPNNSDIWLRDLKRGVSTRFTSSTDDEAAPLYSADGERLFFTRWGTQSELVVRPVAAGEEKVLHRSKGILVAIAALPDGKSLVIAEEQFGGSFDLLTLDLANENQVTPITKTPGAQEFRAALSPNGQWLALQSNESGRDEIYVQPYPGPGRRWQLSTAGGSFPVWTPDGKEIYFRNAAREWSRVPVEAGTSFDAGVPEALFPLLLGGGNSSRKVAITPDGQHFLAEVPAADLSTVPVTVIVGWDAALPR